MKIAIIGTRGIPNNYGGFEQFAEKFAVYASGIGHDIYVYNSHNHSFQENNFKGVHIIHKFDPEYKIGTAGQFLYDLNCILDTKKRNFDIILQLGYSSSAIWNWLLPKNSKLITNMDGLEWKRSKFSNIVKKFLKFSEKLVANGRGVFISDSIGIKQYLKTEYNVESTYIPYGAENFIAKDSEILESYKLKPYDYNLIIARIEPENNIEMIIKGYLESKTTKCLIIIGKTDTPFAKELIIKYKEKRIKFIGGVYNQNDLNYIRYYSFIYFHGHSVGGTNPSLLEAMATNTVIVAHNNIFNRSILESNAFYFDTKTDITHILESIKNKKDYTHYSMSNYKKINDIYNWDSISLQYLNLFSSILNKDF
jgi:glycosyltransferase involved in cell wall biosynthesis